VLLLSTQRYRIALKTDWSIQQQQQRAAEFLPSKDSRNCVAASAAVAASKE